MSFPPIPAVLAALALAGSAVAQARQPRPTVPPRTVSQSAARPVLMRPAISRTLVAFEYGADLWTVPREGGEARRLTAGPGRETDPVFSPDGSQIAFTGEYDGNVDVYVVGAAGGMPRRLTHHPGPDAAVAWTPDGKRVLFRTTRAFRSTGFPASQLFTVAATGGAPARVPLPTGYAGTYASDGARLAYMPVAPANTIWKRYRGGTTTPVWLLTLSTGAVEKVPRDNSNDFSPMWVGDRIYFLSDRAGPVTLFAYDSRTHAVTQALANDGLDLKSASATSDAIVYEQFGSLYIYDVAAGRARPLDVRVAADIPAARPHWVDVGKRVTNATISPTGVRAAFEARGEIFTVPAGKGDVRDLTNTSDAAERDPAWSPDGRWVAYFSDASGEYQLHLRDQAGNTVRAIALGTPPSFYYQPVWSPDSRKIAFHDKRRMLWFIDVASRNSKPVRVDQDTYESPDHTLDPSWSPDSRWLAYTKVLPNYLHAVFVRSLETGRSTQVTDGMSDARFAVFGRDGKHLFFTASTDAGAAAGWLDMSSYDRPVTRSVYVAVLRKDLPSPLAPESDEETVRDTLSAAGKRMKGAERARDTTTAGKTDARALAAAVDSAPRVRIDFDGIGQRILALPIPARNYVQMRAGGRGILWLAEAQNIAVDQVSEDDDGPPPTTVHRFDLAKRKIEKVLDSVSVLVVSANGEKLLTRTGEQWAIVSAAEPAKAPESGPLRVAEMQAYVDPRAEWAQIYRETWRLERDFFYDPNFHGLDISAAKRRYAAYVPALASRAELTHLMEEMLGELSVGHLFVGGGDEPRGKPVPGGLLGADYEVKDGRYRFARIYGGENWNPKLQAPLTQPGVNVAVGDYLLAVNGREVRDTADVDAFFEGTAGKQVVIRVARSSSGGGARDVTVVPIRDESGLRTLAWVERNRHVVDSLSRGKLAYVWLPNTAGAGYTNFNRYYFSQIGKAGAVIDERFNGGGSVADYVVDNLRRPLRTYLVTREGAMSSSPLATIYGPKAMLINELSGSGGDYLPWLFRESGVGKLVGTRTWGGLVGIYDYPQLLDGGAVTAPRVALVNRQGELDIENHGVAPDIEVEFDPAAWRAGRDPQLERAVAVVMDEIRRNPPPPPPAVKYPNYHSKTTAAGGAPARQ